MRKHINLIWNQTKNQKNLPWKSCDVGLRCEKSACFLWSSDAKCLRFGLPLRFGLRCERRDAKSLAMWVERCEPLSPRPYNIQKHYKTLVWESCRALQGTRVQPFIPEHDFWCCGHCISKPSLFWSSHQKQWRDLLAAASPNSFSGVCGHPMSKLKLCGANTNVKLQELFHPQVAHIHYFCCVTAMDIPYQNVHYHTKAIQKEPISSMKWAQFSSSLTYNRLFLNQQRDKLYVWPKPPHHKQLTNLDVGKRCGRD